MRNLIRLLLAISLTSNLVAELVTITGTANYADGSPGAGSLVITYDQFINENGEVIGGSITTPIGADGAVSVDLWSNASSYTVRYQFDVRDQQRTRYWNVPFGQGTALTIPDVEVPTPTNVTKTPVEQISTDGATPGQVITAPSGSAGNASWEDPGGGGAGVSSFNGRVGAVVSVAGDYAAFNAPWITSQAELITPNPDDVVLLQRPAGDGWYKVQWSNFPSGGTSDHSTLLNLDYASSGHTGFEAAIAAGTSALFWDGTKTFRAIVIGDVENLQTELDAKVPTTRTLTGGSGVGAIGDLSANRTINLDFLSETDGGAPNGTDKLLIQQAGGAFRRIDIANLPTGGGGEANTYSTAGVGGVGVTLTKQGIDLPFKSINVGSNQLSVSNDAVNSEVDLDLVPANVLLSSLGGELQDGQLANAYSGIGPCTVGQYANALNRNAPPSCKAVDYGELANPPTLAPVGAGYWTKTPDATLTDEFALSTLETGLLKNTTGSGVPTIAIAGTDYEGPIPGGTPNRFFSWDKTWRAIDWSYLTGTQPAPVAHAASHQSGGGDVLALPSIPGQLPTARTDVPLLNGQQQDLNVQQDTLLSSGAWKDDVITDAGGGSINVATGVGQIRSGATDTSPLLTFEWPTTNGLIPADGASSYVIARYNAGTPDVVVQAGAPNRYSEILLGYVTRAGTLVSITNIGWNISDLDNRLLDWMDSVGGVRDERVGGLVVSDNGAFVAMDSGRYIDLLTPITIPAFDSSGTDRFTWWYRDGVGGWTSEANQQTWPTDQYDDGSGTLATLQNNRFGTLYWYINGDVVHMVFGRLNTNNLAVALDDTPPVDLPPLFAEVTHISSRWVIQQGDISPIEVLSAWQSDSVGGGQVTDHGALTGRSNPDQHPASSVTNTPQGGVTETDAQGAINGLETRKLDKSAAPASIQIILGDGQNVVAVGAGGPIEITSACTLTQATALSTLTGSIQVDIWKDTYANYPPTDADSITGSAPIAISASDKSQDLTLTGWTTAITAGDILWFNVDSAATVNQVTISLMCAR